MTTKSIAGTISAEMPHVPKENNHTMGNIKDGVIDFVAGSLGNVHYNRVFIRGILLFTHLRTIMYRGVSKVTCADANMQQKLPMTAHGMRGDIRAILYEKV